MSFLAGAFTDAISHYSKAIDSSPGTLFIFFILFFLHFCLLLEYQYYYFSTTSFHSFSSLIYVLEPIFELHFNRGVVYTSVRKHEEGLEDFNKALIISPDSSSCLRWRGEVLAKLNRY